MFLGRSGSDSSDSDEQPPPSKIISLPSGPIIASPGVQIVRPMQSNRQQTTSHQQIRPQPTVPRPFRPQTATPRPIRHQPAALRPIGPQSAIPRTIRQLSIAQLLALRQSVISRWGLSQGLPFRPQAHPNSSMLPRPLSPTSGPVPPHATHTLLMTGHLNHITVEVTEEEEEEETEDI